MVMSILNHEDELVKIEKYNKFFAMYIPVQVQAYEWTWYAQLPP
jgi:hypothetical protein